MNIADLVKRRPEEHKDNIFVWPTSDRDAWDMVSEHILGEDWYTTNPISREQITTEQLVEIITMIPSARYRALPWYKKLKYHLIVFYLNFFKHENAHISDYY